MRTRHLHGWIGVVLAGVALVVALVLTAAGSAAAAGTTGTLALQSVSLSAWPTVTMDVVLPADMLSSTLTSGDFSVRENGSVIGGVQARPLATGRRPLDVVLVIDTSGSMAGKPIEDAKAAAVAFASSLGKQDRVAVISFANVPSVVTSFTSDGVALGVAISQLQAHGSTSLYDAVALAARSFGPGAAKEKAVVLLSDGGDTVSGNTLSTAVTALAAANAHLYAVAISTKDVDAAALRALSKSGGGKVVEVGDTAGLTAVFGDIATEMTKPYEVTFTSLRPPARDLEIDLVVTGRDGRAELGTVVTNPDTDPAASTVTAAAGLPWSGWPLGIALAVFAAAGLLVAAIAAMLRPEPNAIGQLDYYEQLSGSTPVTGDTADYVGPETVRGRLLAVAGTVAARGGFDSAIRRELELAGLPLRPAEYMALHSGLVLVSGLLIQFLFGNWALSILVVIVFALGPIAILAQLARKRADAFQAQLPDVLNLLAGSLRAGWGLLQAAGIVAKEIGAPAGPEFERVVTEARLGLSLEDALSKMADRMHSGDFKWAVTAINIQREVGGNLAEVLDLVADTVRERSGLRRQISSLTSEGRLSAVILVALPFVEGIAIWLVDPRYFTKLLSTPIGVYAAVGAGVLLVIGVVWLRNIIRIEV